MAVRPGMIGVTNDRRSPKMEYFLAVSSCLATVKKLSVYSPLFCTLS